MAYLKRKMDDRLLSWKNEGGHLPLVLKGARQVGKTETIRKFAHENYPCVVEVNFATQPRFREIVRDGYAVSDVLRNMTRIDPSLRLEPGRTILFFDEVQDFPDITTSL